MKKVFILRNKKRKQKKSKLQKQFERGIIRLNRIYGRNPNKNYIDRYFCKSRCFKANFVKRKFENVNFRGAILTNTTFKESKIDGVDFLGTNLKKCTFKEATIKNSIFANAKLKGVNFSNVKFENVVFVSTNLKECKNLIENQAGIRIINPYPNFKISNQLKKILINLKEKNNIYSTRVLHLPGDKFNKLNLKLLLELFTEEVLIKKLEKLGEYKKRINTFNQLKNILIKI